MSESNQRIIGGRPLTIETGKLATQADSAVTVRYGDTVVLSLFALVMSPAEMVISSI